MVDFDELKKVFEKEYEIVNSMNILSEEYETANEETKKVIKANVESLQNQLKTVNDAIPVIIKKIELTKPLKPLEVEVKKNIYKKPEVKLTQVAEDERKRFALDQKDVDKKDDILEKDIIKRRKKDFFEKKKRIVKEKRPNLYIKISNRFFSHTSENLIKKGDFNNVRENLIKAKMPFLLNSYVSVTLFTTLLVFIASIFLFLFLLFFKISLISPYVSFAAGESILSRLMKTFWIALVLPLSTFVFMYFYPSMEKGYLGKKIDEELPFLTIHLSAIAGSKIEPAQIFKILAYSEEYVFTRKEMISLINKINVYGYNIASALRDSAKKSPSTRLRDLFNGMATTITTGGNLEEFLEQRSKSLLFEYRLDRERKNKVAETFMDIYISVVIAAPMILMLLLIIIKASGLGGINLSIGVLTFIILAVISLINILFLIVLHLKQPKD